MFRYSILAFLFLLAVLCGCQELTVKKVAEQATEEAVKKSLEQLEPEFRNELQNWLQNELQNEIRPMHSAAIARIVGQAAPSGQPAALSAIIWTVHIDGTIQHQLSQAGVDPTLAELVRLLPLFQPQAGAILNR